MKLLILLLSLSLFSCSFYKPTNPQLDLDCYYEAVKHGNGDYDQEQRIYRACVLGKTGDK